MLINYKQQKQKVLQVFHSVIAFAQLQECLEIRQSLEKAQQRLVEGKLVVVVCGEFKQGKSSLVNALLNEKELFPVDVDITTNLVSSVTYGNTERVSVVLDEGTKEQTIQIQRSEIPEYVTEQGNANNFRRARMLVIETPNSTLKEGLVLVDTPGVGSLNTNHTAIAYAFIPNADAVLFVSDALAPLSTKELDFLKDRVLPHCQNLFFVVTKIDAVQDYQAIVQSNREKLASVLGQSPDQISIIPVASALKQAYLQFQEEEDLEDSNFQALENELWTTIVEQRGQILMSSALQELRRGIAEIKQPIQVQCEVFQKPDRQDEVQHQYQEVKQRLQSLQENNAAWRTKLSDGLQSVKTEIQDKFQDGFGEIRNQSRKYLEDAILLESPEQIASLLEADMDALMSQLGQELSYLTADLHDQIERLTGLDINLFEVDSFARDKASFSPESFQMQQPGNWSKIMQMTKQATSHMSTAAIIVGIAGASVGALFAGPAALGAIATGLAGGATVAGAAGGSSVAIGAAIGSSLGGLIGLATGAKEGLQQIHEKTKNSISVVIQKFLEESQNYCRRSLNKAIKDLEITMRDELTAQLQREKDYCDRNLQSLQEARQLSKSQAAQKIKELQALLQQLKQWEEDVDKLAEVTVSMAVPKPPKRPNPSVKLPKKPEQKQTAIADLGDWADG